MNSLMPIQAHFGHQMSLPQNFSFQNLLDVKKPGRELWTMKEAKVSLVRAMHRVWF